MRIVLHCASHSGPSYPLIFFTKFDFKNPFPSNLNVLLEFVGSIAPSTFIFLQRRSSGKPEKIQILKSIRDLVLGILYQNIINSFSGI